MSDSLIFNEKDRNIFEFILDNIPDQITIVDENCKTIFFNKACEKYYCISKADIIGKDIREFFPNSLLPKVIKYQKTYDNIYNSPRYNSYTVISAIPLYNSEGQLIGGLARDRDITELITLSDMLNKTKQSLVQMKSKEWNFGRGKSYFDNIIGESKCIIETKALCKSVSKTPMNILLHGESGTGKELFAKSIHYESGRKGNFVAINCSAIPSELFESELFGYDAGAFTGARKNGKIGKFEEANGGTLFLDEIGDMPIELQPKILRVLEDGVITPVGSNEERKIDVRIVSATNKDFKTLIAEDKFRKDLYYRLDVFQIDIPPLRERGKDIILMANKFLSQFCMEQGMNMIEMTKDVEEILMMLPWEGNVRELRNIVQRSAIFASYDKSDKIKREHLPDYIESEIEFLNKDENNKIDNESENEDSYELKNGSYQELMNGKYQNSLNFDMSGIFNNSDSLDLAEAVSNLEKNMINQALAMCDNSITKAAKILNIPRTTLYYKMEKYNIKL